MVCQYHPGHGHAQSLMTGRMVMHKQIAYSARIAMCVGWLREADDRVGMPQVEQDDRVGVEQQVDERMHGVLPYQWRDCWRGARRVVPVPRFRLHRCPQVGQGR